MAKGQMTGAQYVYGVIDATPKPRVEAGGVEGAAVSSVASDGLAALVSKAPGGPVRTTRRNLMAHSAVLQEVVSSRCVLPMRFGVVMPSASAVKEELLALHAEQLRAQLDTFRNLVELELRVLCPDRDELLRSILARRPELARLNEELKGRPPEAAYYERIRLGELVAESLAAHREGVLARLLDGLQPFSVDVSIGPPTNDQLVANAEFLVDRERVGAFDDAVNALDRVLGPELVLKYVGPLPPYSFVELAAGEEVPAWA